MINQKLKSKIDIIIRTFLNLDIHLQIDYKDDYKLELVEYIENKLIDLGYANKIYSKDLYIENLLNNELDKKGNLIIPKWINEPSIVILYNIPKHLYETIKEITNNDFTYINKKLDTSHIKFILIDNNNYNLKNIINL